MNIKFLFGAAFVALLSSSVAFAESPSLETGGYPGVTSTISSQEIIPEQPSEHYATKDKEPSVPSAATQIENCGGGIVGAYCGSPPPLQNNPKKDEDCSTDECCSTDEDLKFSYLLWHEDFCHRLSINTPKKLVLPSSEWLL